MSELPAFNWSNKRVFLTGHTGFKGGWLALWLASKGAIVRGYSLDPYTDPNFFAQTRLSSLIEDLRGDIRNPETLDAALHSFAPDVVFHLAAQPLVRLSYIDPITTYETNVIGTTRVLDAIRRASSVKAVVSVTTDKCYENIEDPLHAYAETDPLGGYDPYSSSKACAELVSSAYRQSFFPTARIADHNCAVATARAGNVIGGGDWSTDRLLPDLIRGFLANEPVLIRRPHAVRPWQHVLEPLMGYIQLAEHLLSEDREQAAHHATAYNFGPTKSDAQPVQWIVEKMATLWSPSATWTLDPDPGPHEAGYLMLDATKARTQLAWQPRLNLETALHWLVDWYKASAEGADMQAFTLNQIAVYEALVTTT
ncbi:MAG: CDP-glucose 4,6-dehydratase [Acidobacteriota bacterium]